MTGAKICAVIVGGQCGDWEEVGAWKVQIPEGKPEIVKPTLPQVSIIIVIHTLYGLHISKQTETSSLSKNRQKTIAVVSIEFFPISEIVPNWDNINTR